MGYRKTYNSYENWKQYIKEKADLIGKMNLPQEIFRTEKNFRAFVTKGRLEEGNHLTITMESVDDESTRYLRTFIDDYHFDMDVITFDAFNQRWSCMKTDPFQNEDSAINA